MIAWPTSLPGSSRRDPIGCFAGHYENEYFGAMILFQATDLSSVIHVYILQLYNWCKEFAVMRLLPRLLTRSWQSFGFYPPNKAREHKNRSPECFVVILHFSRKMKVSEVGLIIYYSLLCCAIHGSSNGQANAENILENNPESISNEDTPQFHSENHERRQVS